MFRSGVRSSGLLLGRLLAIVCLTLGVLGSGPVGAHAAQPLQLTNELLVDDGVTGHISSTSECYPADDGNRQFTFSVGGRASGPYPGTFTESGSFTITNNVISSFSASFTITSEVGIVTGTKSLYQPAPAHCSLYQENPDQSGSGSKLTVPQFLAVYTATSNGTNQVTGISAVSISGQTPGAFVVPPPNFKEGFIGECQGLCQNPGMPPPTSKAQCKHGGWKSFGTMFKNQGDCVSFVATGGKNPPSGL